MYTAFWNIAPSVSLFALTLGMAGFTLMNYARAHTLSARIAQPVAQPSREARLRDAA